MSTLRVQIHLICGRCTALLFYAAFFLATAAVPGYAHVEFTSSTGAEFVEEDGALDFFNTLDAFPITAPNDARNSHSRLKRASICWDTGDYRFSGTGSAPSDYAWLRKFR